MVNFRRGRNRLSPTRCFGGFALIEILVAVLIVGVAVPALMLRMQSIANTTAYIEERTIAYWVAENKLQELMIEHQLTRAVTKLRSDSDILEYGGREWYWSVIIEQVPLPEILDPAKMFRVDVSVGLEEDQTLAMLSGFLDE